MLIFQIARIANQDQILTDGFYEAPARFSDGYDCLTTISPSAQSSSNAFDIRLSIRIFSMKEQLPLDEPGSAVSLILADINSLRTPHSSDSPSSSDATSKLTPSLVLLRYEFSSAAPNPTLWVLQRELRRQGMDICFDSSAVLVGYSATDRGERILDRPLNIISRFDALADRDGIVINRAAFKTKAVLIVGLGSVGSAIACDLARSGVGRFTIADHERLEWGNVVRHVAGLSDVGRLKTKIVTDLIMDRNPDAEVIEIPYQLESSSKEIYDQAVAAADVVICATDNRVSRLICNRLSIKHGKKIIFGGLSTGAYAGMVFQCEPPKTMCYHCFVSSFPEAAADREENASAYSGGPDGHLALDIGPITNLMAKLAVVELQKQLGAVTGQLDADLSSPWYMWVNRREGEYAELEPLGSPVKGPQILQWRPIPMEKVEECPHCGGSR